MSYEVEPQLIESFEPELYNEFVTIFKTYDKNGNAVIEKDEFVDLLLALGCTDIDAKDAENLYKAFGMDTIICQPDELSSEIIEKYQKYLRRKHAIK
jgi:hypothetical protein